MENRNRYINLISALGGEYYYIQYINAAENTFEVLKDEDGTGEKTGNTGNAAAVVKSLSERLAAGKCKEGMRAFTDFGTLAARLEKNPRVTYEFERADGSLCRAVFIDASGNGDKKVSDVLFALEEIHDGKVHGQKQELLHETALSLIRDYFSIYCIELKSGSFVRLRSGLCADGENDGETEENFESFIENFCRGFVCAEDREQFGRMTALKYISERLEKEDSYVFRFRTDTEGTVQYFEARFASSYSDYNGRRAVLGIRGVDSETKKDMEYREGLTNAYQQIRNTLSQEEQYRRAIVSDSILVYNVNVSRNLVEDDVFMRLDEKTVSVSEMLGLDMPCVADEFYGRFAEKIVTDEYREAFIESMNAEKLRAAFDRGETEHIIEFAGYFLEGKLVIMRQTMLLFEDLKTNCIIGLCNCKDITETKRKEFESRQALKDAFDSAMLANQAKSDFLSRMSHDIRTPMNAIIGMTAIAGAHIADIDRVKDCLSKISVSSRHLLGIINDILDMSKIESGKINLNEEDFNLSDLLKNLFDMVRPQVKERGHELKVRIHDIKHEDVIGDSLRIQQAFVNIMSNSIKYTPEGGIITVSVTEKPTPQNKMACYEFIFEDNGIGMEQEFIDKIFEPFERAEDLRISKIQGTGLGMAITKNIVSMMGGEIAIESEVGKGSKFTITIFLKLQDIAEADTAPLADLPVLVVDDDMISCENTSIMLKDIGMDSEWVLTGREAVKKVEERNIAGNDYFAIIVDWKMPDMNGVDTTREIRKIVGDKMPIIIISAYDWTDIELEARAAGANAFIGKPAFKSNLSKLFMRMVAGDSVQEDNDEAPVASEFDFSSIRVLLVEDNDLNREIASEILKETGMKIEEAENGKQAVDMFLSAPEKYYDLILMDIQMPVMNGYDATVAIRSLGKKESQSIPIIAMTANAFYEDVNAAISVGMNEHIAKPLDIKKLMECIYRWTRK